MKFYENSFEEYINESQKCDLHPNLNKLYNKFPKKINDLKNLILFGPCGVGKYTQMLKIIKKYCPTDLKYEKKINIIFNKQQFCFKISNIHYEIDMSLLGCNSKLLWHEIYQNIVDIVSAKTDKTGIIVCKYFNEIYSDLLDNFYSYMQQNNFLHIDLKFILITEELSFIPDNILNCCEIINIPRPTKTLYTKCLNKKLPTGLKLENITNIKMLHCYSETLMLPYIIICNKIILSITNFNDLHFLKFRDILYDIFIYNLDISDCIWYIINNLVEKNIIKNEDMSEILIITYNFFKYYNNNYRPIYHVEKYFLNLMQIIHKL